MKIDTGCSAYSQPVESIRGPELAQTRICNVPQDNSVIKIDLQLPEILAPEACKDDPDSIWRYQVVPLTPSFDLDAMEVTIDWNKGKLHVLGV